MNDDDIKAVIMDHAPVTVNRRSGRWESPPNIDATGARTHRCFCYHCGDPCVLRHDYYNTDTGFRVYEEYCPRCEAAKQADEKRGNRLFFGFMALVCVVVMVITAWASR